MYCLVAGLGLLSVVLEREHDKYGLSDVRRISEDLRKVLAKTNRQPIKVMYMGNPHRD